MSTLSRKQEYQRYLTTAKWRRLRKRVLERDEHACTRCGATEPLHVHHLSYKHVFEEPLEDLVTLCDICHLAAHNTKKEKRKRKKKQKRQVGWCRTCGTHMGRPFWHGGGGFYCGPSCKDFAKKVKVKPSTQVGPLWAKSRKKNQGLIDMNDELHRKQQEARALRSERLR